MFSSLRCENRREKEEGCERGRKTGDGRGMSEVGCRMSEVKKDHRRETGDGSRRSEDGRVKTMSAGAKSRRTKMKDGEKGRETGEGKA